MILLRLFMVIREIRIASAGTRRKCSECQAVKDDVDWLYVKPGMTSRHVCGKCALKLDDKHAADLKEMDTMARKEEKRGRKR